MKLCSGEKLINVDFNLNYLIKSIKIENWVIMVMVQTSKLVFLFLKLAQINLVLEIVINQICFSFNPKRPTKILLSDCNEIYKIYSSSVSIWISQLKIKKQQNLIFHELKTTFQKEVNPGVSNWVIFPLPIQLLGFNYAFSDFLQKIFYNIRHTAFSVF